MATKNPIAGAIETAKAVAQNEVTIYIGRFNPFHMGHAHVLQQAISKSSLVIVLIGSAGQARSLKNPFTFDERRQMIQEWINHDAIINGLGADVVIAPLRDYPYNNTMWIREVQDMVRSIITAQGLPKTAKVTITGSNRDESTWYLNAFPQWKQTLVDEHRYDGSGELSATQIRECLFDDSKINTDGGDWVARLRRMVPDSTMSFIGRFLCTSDHTRLVSWYQQNKAYKQAWSVAPYAPIFTTVDAVIVQSGHILVVERGAEPGKGLWALPGGFLNQNERLRDAAVREVMEETGIRLAEGKRAQELTKEILWKSIREHQVFDAPDRSMRGRTITHAFFIRLDDTKALPKVKGQYAPLDETGGELIVETAKAFWLPIDEALSRTDMWFEDHHSIIETMIGTKDL